MIWQHTCEGGSMDLMSSWRGLQSLGFNYQVCTCWIESSLSPGSGFSFFKWLQPYLVVEEVFCFGLQSDVTTRFQLCSAQWKRCEMCIFLHACHVRWGGVGLITFLALAHMVDATQHHVSCTCTHGWCYATSCFLHLHTWLVLRNTWLVLRNIMFLALAHMVGATHMVDATQPHVSCTCAHGWCYATSCFLHLHTWLVLRNTWLVLRNIMFLALAHMVDATQPHVSCTFARMVGATQHHVSCTCTHGWCYATHGWCYATSCFLHLRRTNALGTQSPATSHVDQLAARRLLKRPGLLTVMQSVATYRAARVNALGHSPANFLNLNNDSSWLYEWRYGTGEKKTECRPLKTSRTWGKIHIPIPKSHFYHRPSAHARNYGKTHGSHPNFEKLKNWPLISC